MEVLSLTLSPSATHYLYLRKHHSQAGGFFPEARTLFIANLPIDCSERQLAQFFKACKCGIVERVVFDGSIHGQHSLAEDADEEDNEEKTEDAMDEDEDDRPSSSKVTPLPPIPASLRSSGHTAHIIFLDASSVSSALALASSSSSSKKRLKWPPPSLHSDEEPTGLNRLLATYKALHPPLSTSLSHSESFIASYESSKLKLAAAQAQTKYKKGEAIVDEYGFTLVTRGGAYGATLGGGAGVASRQFQLDANSGRAEEREKARRKKKEKMDFYTFQMREQKRKG